MVIRTVECRECGETRTGRRRDGTTVPFVEECHNCGSTAFRDPVDE